MGSARAQSSSVVLVLGDGQSPESAAAISALSQQIAANPRVSMAPATDLTRALVGPLPPRPQPAVADMAERLQAADDAIAKFDYDKALIQLFRAERPLIDKRPSKDSRQRLADINFKLGLIYLAQGSRDRARKAFGAVHFLVPSTELDPARYPPDAVGAFERARPSPNADSTLSVSGSIEDAAVFVDGRPVGTAPVEVSVPAGVHYVLLAKPGYRPSGRRVETQPGGVEPVRIPLGPLPVVSQAHQLRRRLARRSVQLRADTIRAGRQAAAMTGAQVAIVVTKTGEGIAAIAVGRKKVGSQFQVPDEAVALVDQLAPAPIEVPPPPPPPPPWFRRPWALAAMGGAAIAVVSVTTVWLLSGDDDMRASGGLCFPPDC
jgi:hypothetical protein